ncbi:WbqC family protein [Campylobacter jejuni]
MTIAIIQPTFLPWIGYIYMIQKVDAFIFLDNVQFEQRSWQSRNKIKLQNNIYYISLSCQKASQKTLLKDICLDPQKKWREKILKTIHHAYSKSINYKKYFSIIKSSLNTHQNLSELNIELIKKFCKELNIKTPIYKVSELKLTKAKRENLLLQICNHFNANIYLSPEGSKNYLENEYSKKIFKENNIKIFYFNFIHPTYTQQGRGDFIPYLSVLDFLFNVDQPKLEFQKIIQENSKKANHESAF